MSQSVLNDIHQYIKFLESVGYKLSLSLKKEPFAPYIHQLLRYDIHDHAICDYLKQNPGTAGRCVLNKNHLMKLEARHPYYACCYAGNEEFLIPIWHKNLFLGYIHVSGYRGRLKRSLRFMQRIAPLCDERFPKFYQRLSEEVPSTETVLSFARPLTYMLTELYKNAEEQKGNLGASAQNSLYLQALQLLYENAISPMTCEQLSKELNYSASYLRYIFKKEGNVSVQAKINEIRIEKAQRLLRGTTMSVTDIAFATGFEDSNYFSYVFKRYTKHSPLAYRKFFKEGSRSF